MREDWFVPGMAIPDGERTIRLRPPEHWRRDTLEIPRVPPSMNTDQVRGWRSYYKLKRLWQDEIELLLMASRMPRGNQRALAGAFMRFPDARRRDTPNFSGVLTKALADALVAYGAIDDDDAAHYVFGGVEFEEQKGARRTLISVFTQPKEED